ncbi:putative toxin-antitoxin system toxin component, PIN family [Limnofasciculus baicalensis]|uniref:Toxin-antitoxin system toxin component, PIN family n=1 Tax=Limnofasciculus baicalensis BBK-W-15 TaxID=2699891 RepID=A0AAE3GVW8_9CYAN|nr:putative toxin-antitoxin system toxin component, PIN family [Limnofasciculus baicalensis]MCP2731364.1 putative toxin-antitoxin system toxin component, PIN family [Limnofasciculus baicalensis BBK-W-15]
MRYVFDTNVIISALLFENSKPAQALRYALANGEVLLSIELIEELNEVLGRERFNRYVTSEAREEFLEALVERSVLVEIIENVQECRDPKDDKVLELALNGEAQYIISGDRDLLVLHPFRGVVVIAADELLRRIELE